MRATAVQVKVKERPIIFSSPMVKAILEGRKTQTRRILKTQPLEILDKARGRALVKVTRQWGDHTVWFGLTQRDPNRGVAFRCSYGEVGERLWVRETFLPDPPDDGSWHFTMWNDGHIRNTGAIPQRFQSPKHALFAESWTGNDLSWMSPIHMPRWASRITLEITNVRVERLQEISAADAIAEGIRTMKDGSGVYVGREGPRNLVTPWPTAKEAFADGWDSINGKRKGCAWSDNPWVWAISFVKL